MSDYVLFNEILIEIDNPISFANFGKKRLEEFTVNLENLLDELPYISKRSEYLFFLKSYSTLTNSLQSTTQSLEDWQSKTAHYQQLFVSPSILPENEMSEIKKFQSKLNDLSNIICQQIFHISKITPQLAHMKTILDIKKIALQPTFATGLDTRVRGWTGQPRPSRTLNAGWVSAFHRR